MCGRKLRMLSIAHLLVLWLLVFPGSISLSLLVYGQQMQISKSLPETAQLLGRQSPDALVSPQTGSHSNSNAETRLASRFETYSHYFSLCAVTKDRPGNLREWVDYHHALGVTKFYIFDTDQRVPNGPVLQDYIEEGTVEYYHLPNVNPRTIPLMQVRLYYLCLKHISSQHQFVGFWDVDEFLVLADPSVRFPEMLREYENVGGLVVNWRLLGSSGHLKRPTGGVLDAFVQCTPENYHENYQVKTIVNTRWAYLPTTDPHHFAFKDGKYAVNTAFERVEGAVNVAIRNDRLVLYHYALKSAADYKAKMLKGSAMGNHKTMRFFERIDEASTATCTQARTICRQLGLAWCPTEGEQGGQWRSRLPQLVLDVLEREAPQQYNFDDDEFEAGGQQLGRGGDPQQQQQQLQQGLR